MKDNNKDLAKYSAANTKFCEGLCDRKVIETKTGFVVICDGCERIVIDNRKR